jgi:hypothetical protein
MRSSAPSMLKMVALSLVGRDKLRSVQVAELGRWSASDKESLGSNPPPLKLVPMVFGF